MARARKLFPSYGGALAARLLGALERERVVGKFVAAYVSKFDRRGIQGGPLRDRELAETIGREAMMAMVLEVREALSRFYGKKKRSALDAAAQQAVDAFYGELLASIGRAWNLDPSDLRQFRRDLALYSDSSARQVKAEKNRRQAKLQPEESPFVGRVALLLDPSMLDQARRAAREFHQQIRTLAHTLLRETLRPARR